VTRDGVLRAVLKLASLKQLRSVLGHHPWSRDDAALH